MPEPKKIAVGRMLYRVTYQKGQVWGLMDSDPDSRERDIEIKLCTFYSVIPPDGMVSKVCSVLFFFSVQ